MKPIQFSKFLAQCSSRRSFRLALAAPTLGLTLATAQAGAPATPTAPAEEVPLTNWIGFTVGGAFVSGNDAGMMRRTHTNGDFYGGIDSFQFSKALNDKTTLTLDGHALPGLEDYEFNLDLTRADVGYVKAGYKQFRTWYDGHGGYSPGHMYGTFEDQELSLDRGEIYFEAGLRMEKVPEITFSYKHDFRNGEKDSLAWGEGIPTVVYPGPTPPATVPNTFKLMPAMWDIDEKSDTFELDINHTLGNTDLGLGLTYEHASYSNTRYNTKGYDVAVTTPPTVNKNAYRDVSQTDDYTMDLFAGNIHSVTRFNDKLWLTAGFAYNKIDTDTDGGSRSFDYPYSIYKGTRGPDAFYRNMQGDGQVEQLVGNLNLMWAPIPDLVITPSLRYEHEEQNVWALVNNYTLFLPPSTPATSTYPAYSADTDMDEILGALDIRYTGIENIVLYAKGEWGNRDQTVVRRNISAADPVTRDWLRNDIQVDEQQYTLGANWYPMSGLSFSLQGLYAERDQSFDPTGYNNAAGTNGTQGLTAIMMDHETQTEDINLRMTWRPLGNLSLVTRYDYTQTEYRNRGVAWDPTGVVSSPAPGDIWAEVQSGEVTSNIISESVTWSPMARLYVQGTASWIWSQTDSKFTNVTDSSNDYFSGSLTAGYAIDDRTDITGSLTYYGASNYAAAPSSMGYGLNTDEFCASLTLTRMLTPNMVWNLRYAYVTSNTDNPDQTGGYSDFDAHMVSTGLQIRF